ncbi:DUF4245 family protein [Quadrisphaera setariae]|uniref:DUF4245 family protein n=2 Tax=Quadrisphaera setariae TaxID=2593304 RepID=A0A5C8ZF41_9ACTN|nr:DUF4245 family protein [Quadrisphaera setariae]
MLRTVLFVLGLVLVVFFLTARPQGDQRPPADVAASAAQASAAGVPLSAPQLPEGWKASTTRFGPDVDEGLPTFEAGYLDPAGAYGGISATAAATPGWVRGIAGQDAASDGTREVAGRTWEVWTTTDPRSTTLVSDPSSSGGGPALAVTSRGSEASLDALAQAAVAAVGSAPTASATAPASPSDAASSALTDG